MIRTLYELSQHLDEEQLVSLGLKEQTVSWLLEFDPETISFQVIDKRGDRAHSHTIPVPMECPTRSNNLAPRPFADKAEYVFGLTENDQSRADARHAAWMAVTKEACRLLGLDDLESAIESSTLKPLIPEEMTPNDYVAIKYDLEYPWERDGFLDWWIGKQDFVLPEKGVCSISGVEGNLCRLLPVDATLKVGTVTLSSFNKSAYESWGWEKGENVRIGADTAFRATRLLSRLSEAVGRRYGDYEIITVCSDKDPAFDLENIEDKAEEAAHLLDQIFKGGRVCLGDNYYLWILSANKKRLKVHCNHKLAFSKVKANIDAWFNDLEVDSKFHPYINRLLDQYNFGNSSKLSGKFWLDLTLCAYFGKPLPLRIYQATMDRIKAERGPFKRSENQRKFDHAKLGIVKCYLTRLDGVDLSMENQMNIENPAYHCGRILSLLEKIQMKAMGEKPNATIVDKHFVKASQNPAYLLGSVLPSVVSAHLSRIRKDKPGLAAYYSNLLAKELEKVKGLKTKATLVDQGYFALGYYHEQITKRNQDETDSD